MIKRALVLVFLSLCSTLQAQINEIGLSLGASNFIGDIGSTQFIAPKNASFGLLYRLNRSPRHSWRFSYHYLNVFASDSQATTAHRKARGFSFKNDIHELSAGIEFNFFPFDLHHHWNSFTPYVYTGISAIQFQENFHRNKKQNLLENSKYAIALPFIVGGKFQASKRFIISAEIGIRYALTDNIDGNNPKQTLAKNSNFFGNHSNDWFVFSGIIISYTFGKNPCYCAPQ